MTKIGFLGRFTLFYTVALLALTGVIAQFEIEGPLYLDTVIFLVVALWCIERYVLKNRRLLAGEEKWHIILLALLGDGAATILLGAPQLIAANIDLGFLIIGMAITLPIHWIVLILLVRTTNKKVAKLHPELVENL